MFFFFQNTLKHFDFDSLWHFCEVSWSFVIVHVKERKNQKVFLNPLLYRNIRRENFSYSARFCCTRWGLVWVCYHKSAVLLWRNVGVLIVFHSVFAVRINFKLLRKCFIGNLLLSGLFLTLMGLSCAVLVWAGYGVQRKLSRVIVIGGDMELYFPAVPCNSLGVVW